MSRWFHRSPRPQTIEESKVLQGDVTVQSRRVSHELDELLDRAIQLFAPARGLLAEVLIGDPDTRELITWDLRPDTSPAMYFRLRPGEGRTNEVFTSGIAFAGEPRGRAQSFDSIPAPLEESHLRSTCSALIVPLKHDNAIVGVLNLESPASDTFSVLSLERLGYGNLIGLIAAELAKVTREPLAQAQATAYVIDMLRRRIAFAFNPEDMDETYYQILRVAGQVVRPNNVSGGLILVRDEFQNLVESKGLELSERTLYAVRAARIGAFNSDPEWELEDKGIARRIIQRRKGELIGNARADPDYRDSGTGLAETSELIVPLVSGDAAFGVIGLVSPGLNAFNESDLADLERVTAIAVYSLERAEEFRRRKRHSDQLRLNRKLLQLLSPLFPENMRQLTTDQINDVRSQVSKLILTWALAQTESEHGVFVLAEAGEEQLRAEERAAAPTYLVIHEFETTGELVENGPRRWLATQGISGAALAGRKTVYSADAQDDPTYIPFFANVRSEVATPLLIGETALGVLDLESNSPHHFTSDHVQWAEFLAQQAAFALATIDRAVKTHIELTLADLSMKIDAGIDDMRRATDLHLVLTGELDAHAAVARVRKARYDLVKMIIDTMLPVTSSWVGRLLIALNAYNGEGDRINVERGRLFYLVSTDTSEETDLDHRFFTLDRGVSGRAFSGQQMVVFNDLAHRPEEYFDSSQSRLDSTQVRDSQAGIFMPVWEGTRISGILNLESEHAGTFTPDAIRACQIAAGMASKVMTTARLRILVLLRQLLRDFESMILRMQSADLNGFIKFALSSAADLSDIRSGWGTVALLRQPFSAGQPVIDRQFWMTYAPRNTEFSTSGDRESADYPGEDYQPDVQYPVYIEAMKSQKPVLILDNHMLPDSERSHEPWESDARSIICVPLLRPTEAGGLEAHAGLETSTGGPAHVDDEDTVGVLALAHRNPAEFSEFDKEMLSLFAQSIIQGLKNTALLQARKDLLRQVRHDFSETLQPLNLDSETLKFRLNNALSSSDLETALRQIQGAREINDRRDGLVFLFSDLMTWFFDLSDDGLQPEHDASQVMTVESVVERQRRPIASLAKALRDRSVEWQLPEYPIYLQGGELRARMIRAALFQYLDNAIKYGESDTIVVAISQHADQAVFAVKSAGDAIPASEWKVIFDLYYRGSNATAENSGSGIGLFQVKQIATRLHGSAYYLPDSTALQNVFYLSVPAMSRQTM